MPELLLSAELEIDGYLHRLEVFGDHCADLHEPLARCGGYLRGQAKHRIEAQGPGWKALSPETVRRKMTTPKLELLSALFPRRRPGNHPVQRASERRAWALNRKAVARTTRAREAAEKRAAHEGETLAFYQRAFGAPAGIRDVESLVAFAEHEARRMRIHGEALRAARAMPLAEGEERVTVHYRNRGGEHKSYQTIENISAERRRVRSIGKPRYMRSERSTHLLGGLYNSIHLRVEAKLLVVFSGPSWSGIHNRGGVAGHGARIPERRFLIIEAADVKVFSEIFRSYLLEPFLS